MAPVRRFKAHPQSAPGDFYVVNDECIACGAPHAVAPDLIGWATNVEYEHCIWKKQPETPEELDQAFAAFDASEVGCYRYAGNDPTIMARIGSDYCDQAAKNWKPQSLEDGVLLDNHPIPVHFTLTISQQPSLFSKLAEAVASLFKRKWTSLTDSRSMRP